MSRCIAATTALAVALIVPAEAAAHDDEELVLGPPVEDVTDAGSDVDRWRVHLALDLASWIRQAPWPRIDGQDVGTRDHIGFIGFRRFHFGFGIGRGIRDTVVLGVHFDYGVSRGIQRTPIPVDDARAVEFTALPYAELLLVRKHIVRPFFLARAGLGGALVALDGSSPIDSPDAAASLLMPTVGFGLGAHAFATKDISIDGLFTVDHRWEYARLHGGISGTTELVADQTTNPDAIEAQAGHESFGRRFTVSIGIAVSRWF